MYEKNYNKKWMMKKIKQKMDEKYLHIKNSFQRPRVQDVPGLREHQHVAGSLLLGRRQSVSGKKAIKILNKKISSKI